MVSGNPRTMTLRPANACDIPEIFKLLEAVELPTRGVADHVGEFVVFESGGAILGVGGLEVHGSHALLRSLAVSPAHQGVGLATAICDHLEAAAERCGIESIYLLTETADEFFAKRGYVVASRTEAPREIASAEEFSVICPQSATFMRRTG
jgi:amino-acid N-acetyltransferase